MKYLTPKEAAAQLNVHPKTIIRAAQRGEIQAVRIGRQWRVLVPATTYPFAIKAGVADA